MATKKSTKKKKKTTRKKRVGRKKKTTATARRGPGRRKKKKTTRKKRGTRALTSLSTADLQAELERRESQRDGLERERDALVQQLEAVEAELSALGGAGPRRRGPGRPRKVGGPRPAAQGRRRSGRRARNATNLVDALKKTLTGKTLSVTEATEQVQKEGYKTTSANFRTIVNQALTANRNVFKKVARGQYTAK